MVTAQFLVFIVAIFIGIIAAMVGIGGGALMVPVMILLLGVEPHQAVGTSLHVIILTATSSTIAYYIQRRIDFKVGVLMPLVTIPGSVLGAYTTKFISPKGIVGVFGAFLILIALKMLTSRERRKSENEEGSALSEDLNKGGESTRTLIDRDGKVFTYRPKLKVGLLLGFSAGFASGFLGIGGGALMVPILNLVVGLPIHLAVATSMFIMVFSASFGATTHFLMGNLVPEYVVLLGAGVILGAQIGARTAKRLKASKLRKAFAVVLIFTGLRMLLKALG
ncbi:MAG: sulfite exporter TauE/SafE family protein [Thermoproteota archaeon]|nr:MAG: sulfite exporter TauE/SafE family protein [Candidatus Korarchaeota archaeon]